MIALETIKKYLFSDALDQKSLLKTIRVHNKDIRTFDEALHSLFFELDEEGLQVILAPYLRAAAIKHVKTSEGSQYFRTQLIRNYGQQGLDSYLKTQSRNTVFGADEEAKALAELFDAALELTVIYAGSSSYSYVAREATGPIVHIYNQINHHWYIYKDEPAGTIGDGNCLYNSFAQILRLNLITEDHYASLFSKDDLRVYQTQDQLRANFDQLPRHTNEQLANIISSLTEDEAADHKCALECATQDLNISMVKNLLNAIDKLRIYGDELKDKGFTKGKIAIELASDLKEFVEKHENTMRSPEVQKNFSTLLNSRNKDMSKYRTSWDTIIKNIAIALTFVGIAAIAVKLIYSATQGRALFFYQKNKTTCEEEIEKIQSLVDTTCKL